MSLRQAMGIEKAEYVRLAEFRSALRRFMRFSESQARQAGLTPQQHQMLLAVKGTSERDWATPGEIAEAMQVNHNAAVGLVQRAEAAGLVSRSEDPDDRRRVRITLTHSGESVLAALSAEHKQELARLAPVLEELLKIIR